LKKKIHLSKQLRHAFVGGLSLKTAWVRVPHGPLIGWVKNSAYGPITIEYTKPPNSVRPHLIYTEENLKKQVFLKRSHLINSSAFLTQVFANNKQVAHDP
jgi:hypothetical protein